MKKILSLSITPLITFGLFSAVHFIISWLAYFLTGNGQIYWDAGIVSVLCYGFISIQTLLENYFFETLNNKK
jgi:uncharacterized membrane protein YvlD (DUF360 family)